MPSIVNPKVKLPKMRRALVRRAIRLIRDQIPNSDARQYARAKSFFPIFPVEDAALQAALVLVVNQLEFLVPPRS